MSSYCLRESGTFPKRRKSGLVDRNQELFIAILHPVLGSTVFRPLLPPSSLKASVHYLLNSKQQIDTLTDQLVNIVKRERLLNTNTTSNDNVALLEQDIRHFLLTSWTHFYKAMTFQSPSVQKNQ